MNSEVCFPSICPSGGQFGQKCPPAAAAGGLRLGAGPVEFTGFLQAGHPAVTPPG